MIVYIEYAVLDNMTIDSILLYLVALTVGVRPKWWRILLASVIGTLCAIAVPILPDIVGYITKVMCVVGMCLACFGKRKLPQCTILLVVYTFTMGGIIIGLLSLFGVDYTLYASGCSYYSTVPLGMYIIAVLLCVVLCLAVVRYIKCRHDTSSSVVDVVLIFSGEHVECSGYMDSGNLLCVDNVPVCFVCGSIGRRLKHHMALAVVGGNTVPVSYTTMSGSSSTIAIRGSMAIGSGVYSVLLCVGKGSSAHGCDVLVNYKLMEAIL